MIQTVESWVRWYRFDVGPTIEAWSLVIGIPVTLIGIAIVLWTNRSR